MEKEKYKLQYGDIIQIDSPTNDELHNQLLMQYEIEAEEKDNIYFGDIFSKVLNTILFDSLDIDHERLDRINQTLSDNTPKNTKLREIESVIIRPSVNFKDVIKHYNYECPNILNQLINLIGSKEGSAHLMSYLMFEPGYLNALIDQGYKDAQPYKDQILSLVKNKKALE